MPLALFRALGTWMKKKKKKKKKTGDKMKTEYVISKRGSATDLMLIQGNRCMRIYSPDPADLRAAVQAYEDAQ